MVITRHSTTKRTTRRSTTRRSTTRRSTGRSTTRRSTTKRSTKSHSLNTSIIKNYADNLRKRGKNKKERLNHFKEDMKSLLKELKNNNPKNAKTILNQTDAGKFVLNLAKMVEKEKKKNSKDAGAKAPERYSECSIFTMALITILFILTVLDTIVQEFHETCEQHNITRDDCDDTIGALIVFVREIFGVIMMFVD